jgi:hypothetical protein
LKELTSFTVGESVKDGGQWQPRSFSQDRFIFLSLSQLSHSPVTCISRELKQLCIHWQWMKASDHESREEVVDLCQLKIPQATVLFHAPKHGHF